MGRFRTFSDLLLLLSAITLLFGHAPNVCSFRTEKKKLFTTENTEGTGKK